MFSKNPKEDFQNATKRIKILLNMVDVRIDVFGCSGKFNEILRDIYIKIRNKYSHGSIDLYNEYNVINATDYFIFYQTYMNVIITLSYNQDFKNIQTSDDLITKIVCYSP